MDIVINTIPKNPAQVQRYTGWKPEVLSDKRLLNALKILIAYLSCFDNQLLPSNFYANVESSAASGRVPLNMWLQQNVKFSSTEYMKELEKRYPEKYFFMVDFTDRRIPLPGFDRI